MPLSEEDKKEIQKLIGASLGETLKGADFTTLLSGAVGEAVKGLKIEETVKAKVEEATKGFKPEDGTDKGKKKADDDKDTSAYDKKLAEIQAQLDAERKGREEVEKGRRQDALHAAARDALIKAGVPADRVPHAMAFLQVQGVLGHDDKGAPGFRGKNKYGQDALLPLEDGLKGWTESPDGKHYLPPKNVQGDGTGGKVVTPTPRTEKGALDWGAVRPNIAGALKLGA